MISISPSTRFLDLATGLITVKGWENNLANGLLPTAGSLVAVSLIGVGAMSQRYGRAAGETLLKETANRIAALVPQAGQLVRGNGYNFLVWLPAVTDDITREFLAQVRQAVCKRPVALPGIDPVQPKAICAWVPVPANTRLATAVQSLEREITRQPEFSVLPTGLARAVPARDELDHRLAAGGLFGRDQLVEHVLAALRLPSLHPESVIIVGQPQAGKTRLLNSLAKLLAGQRLPLAEVMCRPADRSIPCTLLAALLHQFLTAYPADLLDQRFGHLAQGYPWMPGLFPALGDARQAPPPPDNIDELRQGLQTILMEIIRVVPHVAVVHSLHIADPESLAVLASVQATAGHGLRLIGGVDPEDSGMPAAIPPALAQQATQIELPALTQAEVARYIQELLPELSQLDIADALFKSTDGLPLALEYTLRRWADLGKLAFRDGKFIYLTEQDGDKTLLRDVDQPRLISAALACPAPFDFLCTLWKTTPEDAQITVAHGRALGYLRPIDFNDPDLIQFTDDDHANAQLQDTSPEERARIHAEIATLYTAWQTGDSSAHAQNLAYHLMQAGLREQAAPYLKQLQLASPALTPILVLPQASPIGGIESWDIPPANAIDAEDLEHIINAALALRLACIQFRLYPPTSEMARAAVREALSALRKLFFNRPSLIITCDGRTIAFDGQFLLRRDLQIAVRDFYTWMSDGNLRAIGIASSVHEYELARFLHALATFEPKDTTTTLLDKVALLNLTNIKVLTRSFQPDLPQMSMPMGGGGLYPGANDPHTLDSNETIQAIRQASVAPTVPPVPEFPTAGQEADTVPSLIDPTIIDTTTWEKLPAMMDEVAAPARRTMMSNLARWLGEQEAQAVQRNVTGIDRLLTNRIQCEVDRQSLNETAAAIEHRLQQLLQQRDWAVMMPFLTALRHRLDQEQAVDTRHQLGQVLERIGESMAMNGCLTQCNGGRGELDRTRDMVELLGEYALRPLIHTLKNATDMQERIQLMQVLREFGDIQQPLLLHELRQQNPWYVYRNLLQVLAEVGTEESLSAIGERITHSDPRVRAEAVAAAVRIAKERAGAYLVQGLEDQDVQVRARAAGLVSFCPDDRILSILLGMLQSRLGKEENDSVQLTACLGLGYFPQGESREALREIIHPRLFSPYRKKSDEIRSAAVTALAQHLPHPTVEATLHQAISDRSLQVRQTAQRVWHQYQLRTHANPTA